MKRKIILLSVLLVASMTTLTGCGTVSGVAQSASRERAGGHPELDDQEKLTPCATCHQEATPEVYEQWYQSGHGLGNVKCYMCHGTYESLVAVPDKKTCAVCHAGQFQRSAPEASCWDCHPAHRFSVHK